MTTRDKGITLPVFSGYNTITLIALRTTDTLQVDGITGDYTVKTAWNYAPGFIVPNNAAPLTAVVPVNFTISGQNGAAGFAAIGGNIVLKPGFGTGGNTSGNVSIQDTAGNGGAWNTSHIVMGAYHLWIDAVAQLRIKNAAPTTDLDGSIVGFYLSASGAYDPPSLVDGAGTTTTIAVASCALGDLCVASFSLDTQGILLYAWVSAAGTVSVRLQNETGGTLDLAAGTLRVKVIKA